MNKYYQSENNNNTRGPKKDKDKFIRVNWKIKSYECRVIEEGVAGTRLMKTSDALRYAQSVGLDLVEIGYDQRSGVSTVKICDWGKYQYEQKQREKAMKKAARANKPDLKCLQMSMTTDTADLNRMIERAKSFLADGDRVKLVLRFRGRREMANMDMAKTVMKNVLDSFNGIAVFDSALALNGKELSCVLRRNQLGSPMAKNASAESTVR